MIDALLCELQQRKIRLRVVDGRLHYEAPQGALTEELAERLRAHKPALIELCTQLHGAAPEPISAVDRAGPLQLSFAQQRMWVLWKLEPQSTAYCVPIVLRIRGPLDPDLLIQALTLVRSRHETLRMHIVEVDGQPFQAPLDAPLDVEVADLSADGGEAKALARIRQQAEVPVDLSREVPFEVRLFRVGHDAHVLLLRLHHIIFDGGSNQLLMRELWPAYLALCQGQPPTLPTLHIQYADFAAWQRERLSGPVRDSLLAYWTGQLRGGLARLSLPLRPNAPSRRGIEAGEVRFSIPDALRAKLADVGQSRGATLFMTLVSALRILLSRYGGERDFLIGTPSMRRFHPDTEQLIGYFGNTLLLRNPLRPEDSYIAVLDREREAALAAYQNQELPFDMVVQALAPSRSSGTAPLFQAMFLFGESAPTVYPVGPLQVEFLETATTRAKFDLGVWATQLSNGGLSGHFEYMASQFDRMTIEQMAVHFRRILDAMAAAPGSRIDATPLLDAQEADVVLRRWNNTARAGGEKAIHESFAARAAAQPEAVAIAFRDQRLSYGALERQVSALCARLRQAGVQPGDRVIVCLPRTPACVAALLAVLRAGAAYVPVDPRYPEARLAFILSDSGASLVITDAEDAQRWPAARCLPLQADEPPGGDSTDATADPLPVSMDALAYVLYTSGTTGQPKGVEIAHGSAAALVDWALDTFSAIELAFVLAGTSTCFDLSVFELFVPLCGGHCIVLAESPLELDVLPARDAITLINTVPSVMRALLAADTRFPRSLRAVCLAGERLDAGLSDEVYRRTGAARVFDLYGPTEATTYATCKLRAPGQAATIGRPISNTRAYVLDDAGLPVPVGVTGELYLAGRSLARGYLGQPKLTAERFAAPRNATLPETRLYRTGDIVRHTLDGELQYVGRRDDQLKVRGFRVEPAEVRAALLDGGGVDDALVVGRTGGDGTLALVAYVIGASDDTAPARLKAALRDRLPEYMIPSDIVNVDAFPMGFNGKVEPSLLTAPQQSRPDGPARALTPTEEAVAAIWSKVLGRFVGHADDFFDVGGVSLSAMIVVGRVNAHFGTVLPPRALFERSSLTGFAALVDGARREAAPAQPRADISAPVPTTLLQKHLWQVHQAAANPAFLNLWKAVSLRGRFDPAAAAKACGGLLARHPVLGARFPAEARGRIQRFEPVMVELATADLSDVSDSTPQGSRIASFCYPLGAPLDLAAGPCFRFGVIGLPKERQLLIMVVHHIVVDEWSLDRLADEVAALYDAARLGRSVPPATESCNFADYAVRERQDRTVGRFEDQLAWWVATLEPPLARLRLDGGPGDQQGPLQTHEFEIPPELWNRIAMTAGARRTSMFAVSLAALSLLLARRNGEADIRICTNVSRRHCRDFGTTLGPLTDSLILRTLLPPASATAEAVSRVRASLLEAFERLDVPFEEIATCVTEVHGIERQALAQVFFLLDEACDAEEPPEREPELDLDTRYFTEAVHGYDVILYIRRSRRTVRAQLTLSCDAREFAAAYVSLLHELAAEWTAAV